MARWLAGLTLLVLLIHGIVLWGVGNEISGLSSVLDDRADPLFTRSISEQGESTAAAGKPPGGDLPEPVGESIARTIVPTAPPQITPTAPKPPAQKPNAAPVAKPKPPPEPPQIAAATPVEATPTQAEPAIPPATTQTAAVQPSTPTTPTVTAEPTKIEPTPTVLGSATPSTATGNTSSALASVGIWPGDTLVSYRLGGFYRGELFGKGSVQWTRQSSPEAEKYQVRVIMDLGLAKITMTSQGRVTDSGLIPEAFEEIRPNGKRRTVTIDDSGLTLNNGNRLPRPPGAPLYVVQDSVSQFIDLGHRYMSGKQQLSAGSTVRVWLARPGGMDEWVFDAFEPEMLQLPGFKQPVQAFRFVPRPIVAREGRETAEFWIAPSLQYLPVKVRITNGGEAEIVLSLSQIQQR
jgi:hypothetical protein